MSQPVITIDADRLRIHFKEFGPESYALFLKAKAIPETSVEFVEEGESYILTAPARFAPMLGVPTPRPERAALNLLPALLDDQQAIVPMILDAKRFAYWGQCGLGKTLVGLETARHIIHRTDGRVLVITMNEIVDDWVKEAKNFYGAELPIVRLKTRADMRRWCAEGPGHLAVTNYEKMNPEDLEHQVVGEMKSLAGIILDESNRLAMGGGKQKWAIIKSCKGIEYKLSLTATPAPNDIMEFASQASFLEKMRSQEEIIWTYFVRDNTTHRWTVKPHAKKAFFEFMSAWSIYVDDPKHYGWRLDQPDVPEPDIIVHNIPMTDEQRAFMATYTADEDGQQQLVQNKQTNTVQRSKMGEVAKGFVYLNEQPEEAPTSEQQSDLFGAPLAKKTKKKTTTKKAIQQLKEEINNIKAQRVEVEKKLAASISANDQLEALAKDLGLEIPSRPEGKPRTKARKGEDVRRIDSLKPALVIKLIQEEVAAGLSVLVWTVFDEESAILAELLDQTPLAHKYEMVTGSTKQADRPAIIDRFQNGESPVLISRSSMLGFGKNFQCCGSMIFSGFTDSYVQYHQAKRRAIRFKQTRKVRVHLPCVEDLEEDMLDNLFRKETKHQDEIAEQEANYMRANRLRQEIEAKVNGKGKKARKQKAS